MKLLPRPMGLSRLVKLDPALLGMASAFGAAMAYGGSQVVGRKVVTEFAPPLVASLFALFFGALVLAILVHRDVPQDIKAPRNSFLFIGLAGVASSAGVLFMFTALSLAPVVVVSPVASVTPLFALVFTHLFLQRLERVTLRIVIGTLLVVFGVALVTIGNA